MTKRKTISIHGEEFTCPVKARRYYELLRLDYADAIDGLERNPMRTVFSVFGYSFQIKLGDFIYWTDRYPNGIIEKVQPLWFGRGVVLKGWKP